MKMRNLERNMKIRIANPPQESINRHGGLDGYKRKLGGTVQIISKVSRSSSNRVYIVPPSDTKYETISFVIEDIRPYNIIDPIIIKPIMFDPEQLVIV